MKEIGSLDSAEQKQHQQNDQRQPDATAGAVAPTAAMRPGWKYADQYQNQNDQQDGSQ